MAIQKRRFSQQQDQRRHSFCTGDSRSLIGSRTSRISRVGPNAARTPGDVALKRNKSIDSADLKRVGDTNVVTHRFLFREARNWMSQNEREMPDCPRARLIQGTRAIREAVRRLALEANVLDVLKALVSARAAGEYSPGTFPRRSTKSTGLMMDAKSSAFTDVQEELEEPELTTDFESFLDEFQHLADELQRLTSKDTANKLMGSIQSEVQNLTKLMEHLRATAVERMAEVGLLRKQHSANMKRWQGCVKQFGGLLGQLQHVLESLDEGNASDPGMDWLSEKILRNMKEAALNMKRVTDEVACPTAEGGTGEVEFPPLPPVPAWQETKVAVEVKRRQPTAVVLRAVLSNFCSMMTKEAAIVLEVVSNRVIERLTSLDLETQKVPFQSKAADPSLGASVAEQVEPASVEDQQEAEGLLRFVGERVAKQISAAEDSPKPASAPAKFDLPRLGGSSKWRKVTDGDQQANVGLQKSESTTGLALLELLTLPVKKITDPEIKGHGVHDRLSDRINHGASARHELKPEWRTGNTVPGDPEVTPDNVRSLIASFEILDVEVDICGDPKQDESRGNVNHKWAHLPLKPVRSPLSHPQSPPSPQALHSQLRPKPPPLDPNSKKRPPGRRGVRPSKFDSTASCEDGECNQSSSPSKSPRRPPPRGNIKSGNFSKYVDEQQVQRPTSGPPPHGNIKSASFRKYVDEQQVQRPVSGPPPRGNIKSGNFKYMDEQQIQRPASVQHNDVIKRNLSEPRMVEAHEECELPHFSINSPHRPVTLSRCTSPSNAMTSHASARTSLSPLPPIAHLKLR